MAQCTTATEEACGRDSRKITFVVEGQEFEFQKPLLAIHAPSWAESLNTDCSVVRHELPGEANDFRVFVEFLRGEDGPNTEVTSQNVMTLLRWGQAFGVDYIVSACQNHLLLKAFNEFEATDLLEISSRYNMPLLYRKAIETVAQGTLVMDVPDDLQLSAAGASDVFNICDIRTDIVKTHISMGLMRNDGESRRRYRFADHTALEEPRQRARLYWKNRSRFVQKPEQPAEHDWRALQAVWPHHSLRGEDWTVVPCETQPTMPLRNRGVR